MIMAPMLTLLGEFIASFDTKSTSNSHFSLPRKYSNDKNRDSSVPIVGTSGSTPLHFAAANGNTNVVQLLLRHGAHPDRPDKHTVTPEMLARENGWVECAQVLHDWILNKDRDLRERAELDLRSVTSNATSIQSASSEGPRRRLHVKQSIDTALNLLRSEAYCRPQTSTPPASPSTPMGDVSLYHLESTRSNPIDPNARRPSLPHILHPPSPEMGRQKKPAPYGSTPKQRRPRSAGNGAERPQEESTYPVYGRGGSGRRLGSKYSLLNLFKKGQLPEESEGLPTETSSLRGDSPASSASAPILIARSQSKASDVDDLVGTPSSWTSKKAFRFHRASDASARGHPPNPPSLNPSTTLLSRKPSGNLRGSLCPTPDLSSAPPRQDASVSPLSLDHEPRGEESQDHLVKHSAPAELQLGSVEGEVDKPLPSPRPGILRAHTRTASGGQSPSPLPSRTLRFDAGLVPVERKVRGAESPRSATLPLRSYNSAGSLTKLRIQTDRNDDEEISFDPVRRGKDEEDQEYGQTFDLGQHPSSRSLLLQRPRGSSFASSISSLSPIISSDNQKSDFPFSINRPPLSDIDDSGADTTQSPRSLPSDLRSRGDSLSSQSTTDSRNAPLTNSSLTSGSGPSLRTPGSNIDQVMLEDKIVSTARPHLPAPAIRRPSVPSPLDVDLSTVSSHAQAEALVEIARQEALDFAGNQKLSPPAEDGRTPLSARLAAYGETLALERKLREQTSASPVSPKSQLSGTPQFLDRSVGPSIAVQGYPKGGSVERQSSLESRPNSRAGRTRKEPRRPSTADAGECINISCVFNSNVLIALRRLPSGSTPEWSSTRRAVSRSPGNLPTLSTSPTSIDYDYDASSVGLDGLDTHIATRLPDSSKSLATPTDDSLSQISSLDVSLDVNYNTTNNNSLLTLDRATSNVPTQTKGKRENASRSAKKLTKMGYSVTEQAAARTHPSTTPPKRFGLKSLIHTLKGKT